MTPEQIERKRKYAREYKRRARLNPAKLEREKELRRAWRAANAEKERERLRAYPKRREGRPIDDKGRSARAEYQRAWRAAHAERDNDMRRAWRAANAEKERERMRAVYQRRRASCKTSTDKAPTAAQLKALLKDTCLYCDAPAEHVDHFIPLARGGTHTLDNLVASCAACNTSKGAKLPDVEWTGRAA